MIEQIIIFGAISSGVYALLALGFTLIYGIAGITNLAHGSFYMIGAYMFSVFAVSGLLGPESLPISILGFICAVAFVAIVGGLSYRLTIHPVLGDEIAMIVSTVCLALIFQQIIMLWFGTNYVPVRWPINSPLNISLVNILGVYVIYSKILAFAGSALLFAILVMFISFTRTGKAMKAVSQDREVAMLMGINTERLYTLTMAISAAFAAVASILITTSTEMSAASWMWMHPLALSFSIVILGGLGSIKGSLIGAFIMGYAEEIVKNLVPEGGGIVTVVPLLVMVLVLLLRPKGLFGKRIEMEE